MKIETADINTIKPYENNPRKLKDSAIEKVAMSLKEYGFRQPIVVDKDRIIVVGHTRYRASKKLGLKEVPITIADNLTPEQINAYRIADNRTAEESEWDSELLAMEIKDLEAKDFKLDLLGFNEDQLNDILFDEKQGLTDEDEVPEAPEEPISKLGDIWKLGNHRVMCGDCTMIDDVEKLIKVEKADMLYTDPPYNIDFKGTMSNTSKNGIMIKHDGMNSKYDSIHNDKKDTTGFYDFISSFLNIIKKKCVGAWYISFSSKNLHELLNPIINSKIEYKSIIIWVKNQSPIGGGAYRKRYEPIVYGNFSNKFYGKPYSEDDVWEFNRTNKNNLHPTMKPIDLIINIINHGSKINNIVLDLFLGSGSTLIACEKTKRKCYGMELDPKYCDVIIKRWENFTGKKADLENGQN